MASGIRDVGLTGASRILGLLIGVGTQACLGHFMAPAERGSYAVCVTFYTLLGVLFIIGGGNAPTYYVAARRYTLSEGVANTIVYVLAGSVVAMAAGFLLVRSDILPGLRPRVLVEFASKAATRDFYLALVLVPVTLLSASMALLLPSLSDFFWFAVLSVFQGVFQLALYLGMLWLVPMGVTGALLSILINNVVIFVLVLAVFRRRHGITLVLPSLAKLREMFSYGTRYYLGQISNLVNLQFGVLLMAMFAGNEEVGLFAVASTVVNQVMFFPETLTTALVPRVASSAEGRKDLVALCARLSGLACGAMLLALAALAVPVIWVLCRGTEYLPAAGLIRILAVGVFIRCVSKVFETYLILTDRPGAASTAVATGMAVNVGLMLVLLPTMRLAGAAWSINANYVVSSVILFCAFSHFAKMSVKETWRPRRSDLNALGQVWRKLRGGQPKSLPE